MPGSLSAASGLLVLLLVGGTCGLAGCSDDDRPTAAPTPAPAALPATTGSASSSTSAEIDDPPGMTACQLLLEAVGGAALMQPGVVNAIESASTTADAPIAEAAHRLASLYASAVAAKGGESEPDAVAAVSAAGTEMSEVCAASGLGTVG